MANPVCEVLLTEAELVFPDPKLDASAGAIVDFFGVVRRLEDGREIDGIDYEAHPRMTEHHLKLIAQQTMEKFTLQLIIVHHRLGFVAAGEASLYARVATRNRAEAFQASQWLIDELKRKVPIWKRPRFKIDPPKDGSAVADNQPVEKVDLQSRRRLISQG
jgi:molybdopterin synthase catalytic subunit